MKRMKKLTAVAVTIAMLAAVATGCSTPQSASSGEASDTVSQEQSTTEESKAEESTGEQAAAEGDQMAPYAEEITMDFAMLADVNGDTVITTMAEKGEPIENNRFVKLFKDKLNIKMEYSMVAAYNEYIQNIRLGMTDGNLPDYFKVLSSSDFVQMADAGILEEMGPYYEKYASPLLRSIIEKEGKEIFDTGTYGGKIYGIPTKMPSTNGYNHLWIRQDWLDKLKLERPKTIDDLYNVIKAFKEQDPDGNGQDDTFGVGMHKGFMYDMKGLFWGHGSYITGSGGDMWLEGEDGKITSYITSQGTKDTITFLNKLYKEGLVDPEFGTKDGAKSEELIVSGKVGMSFAPHWFAYTLRKSIENDEKANWISIPLPTVDSSGVKIPLTNTQDGLMVAKKGASNPEAIVKMLNVYVDAIFGENGKFNEYFAVDGVGNVFNHSPIFTLDPMIDIDAHYEWKDAAANGTEDQISGPCKGFYDSYKTGNIEFKLMFGPKDTPFEFVGNTYPQDVLWNKYIAAPVQAYVDNGSTLDELVSTQCTAMVTGEVDIATGFDKMVADWYALGGQDAIDQVNEALGK